MAKASATIDRKPPATLEALPPYLREQDGSVCLAIKAQPRAARNEIGEAVGGELKIKITAPPVDDAANEALLRFLATVLACSRGAVVLLRGHTARHKVVQIHGLTAAQVAARLKASS